MVCCCGHHHHCHCWHPGGEHEGWGPYRWRAAPSPREAYLRRLEEEREILERRLRRVEQELEELRRGARQAEGQP